MNSSFRIATWLRGPGLQIDRSAQACRLRSFSPILPIQIQRLLSEPNLGQHTACRSNLPFALGTCSLPVDDATTFDDPSYGPMQEVSFDDNVWPRSIPQPVQEYLKYHFQHIDDSSGIDENANDKSECQSEMPTARVWAFSPCCLSSQTATPSLASSIQTQPTISTTKSAQVLPQSSKRALPSSV